MQRDGISGWTRWVLRTTAWAWIALMGLGSSPSHAVTLNLELFELTGGGVNLFSRNVYLCPDCTIEQFHAVPLPGPNWQRNAAEGTARIFLADSASNTPPPPPPGTTVSFDFVPEIPGDDHFLIAQVLGGAVIGNGAQGLIANIRVARGTTYTFLPGRVVHKLTNPIGEEWVMFTIAEDKTATFDPDVVDGLAAMSVPVGWSYSSELLADPLTITTPTGVADVVTVPDHWTWQKIVPEPGVGILLAAAVLGFRRRRVALRS